MALPIKPNPELKGKDAENFHKEMKAAEARTMSNKEFDRIKNNYKLIFDASNPSSKL